MEDVKYVARRWQNACIDLGVTSTTWIGSEWDKLRTAYTSPDRHYHDIGHIAYVLRMLERYRALAENVVALDIGATRHDEVFLFYARPKGLATNEVLSACVADEALQSLNVHKLVVPRVTMDFRQRVFGIIDVTHHNEDHAPRNQDEKLMADIDWSPMGSPWPEFLRNRKRIRAEYRAYSDAEFVVGRGAFLAALANKQSYFHLDEFKREYDEQAKANVRMDLELCKLPWQKQVEIMDVA